MPTTAPYDDIADWYENTFLTSQRSHGRDGFADGLGIDRAVAELLGHGTGTCVEIGCGTGIYADRVGSLGWVPVGVELSAGMLRHAHGRLAAAQGDAVHLPFASNSVPAVISVMAHTDMADYPAVVAEAHCVLLAGGVFVDVGVHPCFCGGYADRTDPSGIVIRPGYLDGNWTTASWTDQGLRDKVGAAHWPLASLLDTVIGTGLGIYAFAEGAEPTPVVLSPRAIKSAPSAGRIVDPPGTCGGRWAADPTPSSESTRCSNGGRGPTTAAARTRAVPRGTPRKIPLTLR